MSLAENLLNSLDETAYQNMRIAGGVPEEHIKVGQDRVITVPNSLKTIAVKGDKDIETATIDCVRYWDGHDLSTFAIYLNYILPSGDEGTYIPQSITKSEDTFSFDWQIGSEFTYSQGKLTFWIVAKLTDNSGTLVRQWSSFQNSDCTIAQGGDKIYVPEKQTDQDVISQAISISRASAETAEQQANLAKEAAEKAATDARDAAEDEVSRIIGELGVVQELGDSPNSVVSQLKVTKEFNKTNAKINRNSKRITNLEQWLPAEMFETDSTMAYQKDVPENVLPYASINKIGGMTYKCTVAEGEDGYFTGLRSAKVMAVKSVGRNLIPFPYAFTTKTVNGVTASVGDDGRVTLNGTATAECLFGLSNSTVLREFGIKENTNYFLSGSPTGASSTTYHISLFSPSFGGKYDYGNGALVNYSSEQLSKKGYFVIVVKSGVTLNNVVFSPMLNEGSTAEPYAPYHSETLPIPEVVQALDGWGQGIPDTDYYNFLDWRPENGVTEWHQICAKREYKEGDEELENAVTDGSSETVYLLDKEIVTDISDLLPADNLISVEGGGTLTFENEYGYAVPSEVEYQVEV